MNAPSSFRSQVAPAARWSLALATTLIVVAVALFAIATGAPVAFR